MRSKAYRITFFLSPIRGDFGAKGRAEAIRMLLDSLVAINRLHLHRSPGFYPPLYESGVRYQAEPLGREDWQDIPETIFRGEGDCEDLACWRVAELQEQGIDARPELTRKDLGAVTLYHVAVRLPNGSIEDPSRRLGMGEIGEQAFTTGAGRLTMSHPRKG